MAEKTFHTIRFPEDIEAFLDTKAEENSTNFSKEVIKYCRRGIEYLEAIQRNPAIEYAAKKTIDVPIEDYQERLAKLLEAATPKPSDDYQDRAPGAGRKKKDTEGEVITSIRRGKKVKIVEGKGDIIKNVNNDK